jgi:D-xylose transport system permease protein
MKTEGISAMAKLTQNIRTVSTSYFSSLKAINTNSFAVLAGLVIIGAVFQLANSNFLSPLNLTNLMTQISAIGILSVGVVLILLIGEIDLSVGAVSGVTAAVMAVMTTIYHVPSIIGILVAIICGLLIGSLHGLLVTKVHVPAFVVTMAGALIWQGAQMTILGNTGTINLRDPVINGIANALLPPSIGWILGIAVILVVALSTFRGRSLRAQAGLTAQPLSIAITKLLLISFAILAGIGLMNIDRNLRAHGSAIKGVPSAVLGFLAIVIIFDIITRFTVFGRHLYTIGGNTEAARRASIDVDKTKIVAFALCSGLAACGGLVFASRLIAVNWGSGSGDVTLSAIAAAVIGGTSLFGGRGTTWAAFMGALIIGSISNGMDLLSFSSSIKFIITGGVLLLAVILDSVNRESRKRSGKE